MHYTQLLPHCIIYYKIFSPAQSARHTAGISIVPSPPAASGSDAGGQTGRRIVSEGVVPPKKERAGGFLGVWGLGPAAVVPFGGADYLVVKGYVDYRAYPLRGIGSHFPVLVFPVIVAVA